MKASIRIAGVSIDPNNLPTREQIFALALNTKEHRDNPFREKEINNALNESGFWDNKEPTINQDDGLHTVIAKQHKKFKRGGDK
jgi:hypothetical protein